MLIIIPITYSMYFHLNPGSLYLLFPQTSDKNYMYLLFAADPYETISFKVPNSEVDKSEGKLFTHW